MTHSLIAALVREGHWQLTELDAKAYAQAVKNVARHYSLGVTQKALDWYALGMCMAHMEGSRVVMSYRNARSRRGGSQSPGGGGPRGPAQVFEFTPRPAAPSPANPAGQPAPSTVEPSPQPEGTTVEGFTGDGIDGPIGGNA
jgi:hypothetical protein